VLVQIVSPGGDGIMEFGKPVFDGHGRVFL